VYWNVIRRVKYNFFFSDIFALRQSVENCHFHQKQWVLLNYYPFCTYSWKFYYTATIFVYQYNMLLNFWETQIIVQRSSVGAGYSVMIRYISVRLRHSMLERKWIDGNENNKLINYAYRRLASWWWSREVRGFLIEAEFQICQPLHSNSFQLNGFLIILSLTGLIHSTTALRRLEHFPFPIQDR